MIAIIAILAGMLLPALSKAKEKAQAISCTSKEKQLALGGRMYAMDYQDWLPIGGSSGEWKGNIYTYVTGYKGNETKDYLPMSLIVENPAFICPSLPPTIKEISPTMMCGYGWNNQYLGYMENYPDPSLCRQKLAQVQKPDRTIMFGDTIDFMCTPDVAYIDYILHTPEVVTNNFCPYTVYATRHSKGLNMAFVDGHVEWFTGKSLESPENNPYLWLEIKP